MKIDSGTAAIIASGIASLVSLIIFIGSTIYSRMNTDKPYKTKIYEQQLFKVFKPLEILIEDSFIKYGSDVTPELLKEVKRIIYANFTLIPDTLLCEYKKLADSSSDKEQTALVIYDIVSTYYNLRRKELGYPFKREAISLLCLDVDERMSTIKKSLKSSMFVTIIIFAVAAALIALILLVSEKLVLVIEILFVVFVILTLIIWSDNSLSLRGQGVRYNKLYKKTQRAANKTKIKSRLHGFLRNFIKRKPREKIVGQNKL